MNNFYYKTKSNEVMQHHRTFIEEKRSLHAQAKAFAEIFGGEPLFSQTPFQFSFFGLTFHERKDVKFWTQPDQHKVQRPRLSLTKASAEDKAILKDLNCKFNQEFPTKKVLATDLYKSIDTDEMNVAINGMCYFKFNDALYFQTPLKLNECEEILASEFFANKEAFEMQAVVAA